MTIIRVVVRYFKAFKMVDFGPRECHPHCQQGESTSEQSYPRITTACAVRSKAMNSYLHVLICGAVNLQSELNLCVLTNVPCHLIRVIIETFKHMIQSLNI